MCQVINQKYLLKVPNLINVDYLSIRKYQETRLVIVMLVVDTVSMLKGQWNWISSCIEEESWRGRRAFGISILRLNYVKLDVLKTSIAPFAF